VDIKPPLDAGDTSNDYVIRAEYDKGQERLHTI
jgi:hypothetical protein